MRFGILFHVEIGHDYWLNRDHVVHEALAAPDRLALRRQGEAGRYLRVTPTAATRAALAGHGMIFKTAPDGFFVGIALDGTGDAPLRPPGPETRLSFALTLGDADFTSYTAEVGPRFFRYANEPGNERAGQLFLSQPVTEHDPARAYLAGDLRAGPPASALELFQARRDTGPSGAPVPTDWAPIQADTHDTGLAYQQGAMVVDGNVLFEAAVDSPGTDLSNPADWTELGPLANQYATAGDRVDLRPAIFGVDVAGEGATDLTLRITRSGAAHPAWQRRFTAEQQLESLQADLRGLPDGLYDLAVLDAAMAVIPVLAARFYLGPQAVAEGWFGVIEIVSGVGSFALLDGSGDLRSPRFRLRFANQSARLRYRFADAQPVGAGAEVAADPGDASILVTPEPLPLTRAGGGVALRADDPGTAAVDERILLPHPGALAPLRDGDQWFADQHLSNLPPLA